MLVNEFHYADTHIPSLPFLSIFDSIRPLPRGCSYRFHFSPFFRFLVFIGILLILIFVFFFFFYLFFVLILAPLLIFSGLFCITVVLLKVFLFPWVIFTFTLYDQSFPYFFSARFLTSSSHSKSPAKSKSVPYPSSSSHL